MKVFHLKHIFPFIFATGSYFDFWTDVILISAYTIFVFMNIFLPNNTQPAH